LRSSTQLDSKGMNSSNLDSPKGKWPSIRVLPEVGSSGSKSIRSIPWASLWVLFSSSSQFSHFFFFIPLHLLLLCPSNHRFLPFSLFLSHFFLFSCLSCKFILSIFSSWVLLLESVLGPAYRINDFLIIFYFLVQFFLLSSFILICSYAFAILCTIG
jgi:hypothetical protein